MAVPCQTPVAMVPTLVSEEVTTLAASEVPVNVPAAAVTVPLAPSATAVPLIVTLLLASAELGIAVKPAPMEPEVSAPTLVRLDETTVLFRVVPVNVPAAAVTVMFAVPSNVVPLIVRPVCNAVAVEALPDSAAVIVPAVKFPDASRATMALAVLALAAVVALLDTFPAVLIVAR